MAPKHNFDHVSLQKAGGWNLITADEFLRIPLGERIDLVMKGKAQFVRDGQVIGAKEALKKVG